MSNFENTPQFEDASNDHVDLLELVGFLTDFQAVERSLHIAKLDRLENDTEHSYNLTMMAWAIVAKDKLPLDLDLVIKYALVHDLVEVYAGDTFALDEVANLDKAAREHEALEQLLSDDLTFDFAQVIEQYEKLEDEESKFVYSLDKLAATTTIIHNRIPHWRNHNITKTIWMEKFKAKISKSIYLKPYYERVFELMDENSELLADESDQLI